MIIGVLSCRYQETMDYIVKELKLKVDMGHGRAFAENGNIYYIIDNPQQAYGLKLDGYIKAPNYYTLEDIVKSRIGL